MARIDGAELHDAIVQALFARRAVFQVETPAVQLGPKALLVQIGHHVAVTRRRVGQGRGHGRFLEIAVQHHLAAVLVSVEPMQHIGRRRLEPARFAAAPGDQGEARRQALMQAHGVDAPFQKRRVPKHRQVVEDGVILGKGHVVRQAGSRHVDRLQVRQAVVGVDQTVMQIRRVLGIVEKHQLAGRLVHLGMGGNAVDGHPAFHAQIIQRQGIEPIALAALIEGREGLSGVNHHVGA